MTTEDHPRAFDNSIYHGFHREGKLRDSAGKALGDPGIDGTSSCVGFVHPGLSGRCGRRGVDGGSGARAGRRLAGHGVFRAAGCRCIPRKARGAGDGANHRYHYARFDGKRRWELFRGKTGDGGATWKWEAITKDSKRDHLRPVIPSNPGGKRIVLWLTGDFKSFTDYRLDVCGRVEER